MLRLRPYNRSDAEAVVKWIDDERVFRMWSADKYERYPISADDMNAFYDRLADGGDGFRAFTAFDERGIAGHITIRFTDADMSVLHVGFIMISPERRGEGLGRDMLAKTLRYAFDSLGVQKVTLRVFENNTRAYGLYMSMGFNAADEAPSELILMGETWRCVKLELHSDKA